MARKSRMSIMKRQRELRKAEKAARKRAKRHGIKEPHVFEPEPTVRFSDTDETSDEHDEHDEHEESESASSVEERTS